MKLVPTALTVLMLAVAGGEALAQQANSLRDQLVGTWQFVVAEVTAPDGRKSFPFGETPKGIRFSHAGIPSVTFGPGEDGWPPVNEYIHTAKAVPAAQVLAHAIMDILRRVE